MSAMLEANIKHLRETIELAANCTVTLQEEHDNWTGEFIGYFAWANRNWETRPGSRTLANAGSKFPIEALDRLAEKLGVDTSTRIEQSEAA